MQREALARAHVHDRKDAKLAVRRPSRRCTKSMLQRSFGTVGAEGASRERLASFFLRLIRTERPCRAVEPVHALVIHLPALPPQENRQTPVAVPRHRVREIAKPHQRVRAAHPNDSGSDGADRPNSSTRHARRSATAWLATSSPTSARRRGRAQSCFSTGPPGASACRARGRPPSPSAGGSHPRAASAGGFSLGSIEPNRRFQT